MTEIARLMNIAVTVAAAWGNYSWSPRRWLLLQVRHFITITRLLPSRWSHARTTETSYDEGRRLRTCRRWCVWNSSS